MRTLHFHLSQHKLLALALLTGSLLILFFLLGNRVVSAQGLSFHPVFRLLDEDGNNVLDSGQAVSTIQTCGACHDTEFIQEHSFHSDVGLSEVFTPGSQTSQNKWDTSPGLFGKWDPIKYRYLSPEGDERIDLALAEWIMVYGPRHVGGGPAYFDQDGKPLNQLPDQEQEWENQYFDSASNNVISWNWQNSGAVEMNCFLCHLSGPNNEARVEALRDGDFRGASTATLLGSGLVDKEDERWVWNVSAFDEDGNIKIDALTVHDPTNENCGQCHGLVHVEPETPLSLDECTAEQWSTITTGQVVSGQRIADSGLNIADKESLSRSWDIHAERVVNCTDCHYSLNNPVYYQESDETQPEHLTFDPRRIDLGEYLYRPLHQFAKGESSQGNLAEGFDNSIRGCESCHSLEDTHQWLPYKERHTTALSCESCHIPEMYAPAREYVDWTVLQSDSKPVTGCRGVSGEGETFDSVLLTGFAPVLLPHTDDDGSTTLAPHNLVSSWYWVYGDPERPVPLRDLEAVWFEGDEYAEEILLAFDSDSDDSLDESELVIDSDSKEKLIVSRLEALGLNNPRIVAQVQPYSIHHNVTHDDWAVKDCQSCHSEESRINAGISLSNRIPGDVLPTFVQNSSAVSAGEIQKLVDGTLYYQPTSEETGLYILGHDGVSLVDKLGSLLFLGTLLGVVTHGGLRIYAAKRHIHINSEKQEVYMYGAYERLWHWVQTVVILILIFTGLIIHKPDIFGFLSFNYVVQVHNIMAALLVANAALAIFYNLASGEIRQYLPHPQGFFNQAIQQGTYYLRGIFRREEHPFEKTPQRRLNPLQQVTYLAILNILLPLQIITGGLIWGAQRWPEIAAQFGGLPLLGPFHTMISWLFASFIVMHVYLTTTGSKPLTNIRSMIVGWDEIDTRHSQA